MQTQFIAGRALVRVWCARRRRVLALVCALAAVGVFPAASVSAAPASGTHQAIPLSVAHQEQCGPAGSNPSTPAMASMFVGTTNYTFLAWSDCTTGNTVIIGATNPAVDSNWGNCGSVCTRRTLQTRSLSENGTYAGPALAALNGTLYIANTGTDFHLWVGRYDFTTTVKNDLQLPELSDYTPALAAHLASGTFKLYLAWTGRDQFHHLNVESSSDGLTWSGKVTGTDTAAAGPGLTDWQTQLYIAWMATNSAHWVCLGYFTGTPFSPTLANHTCPRNCDLGPNNCTQITTEGDVGLTSSTSRLYLGYRGTDDGSGAGCPPGSGLPTKEVNIGASSDGFAFDYLDLDCKGQVLPPAGTGVLYQYPVVWGTYVQVGSGGVKVNLSTNAAFH